MDVNIGHAISVFMGFFAIMNPVANTTVFLGVTAEDDSETRRNIAIKALVVSFVIIVVFSTAGKFIFDLFGITLPAFRIMGGILVALVGYQMLQGGEHSSVQHPSDGDKQKSVDAELSAAITPLAMPILTGPGAIATAMNFASTGGAQEFLVTIGAFFMAAVTSSRILALHASITSLGFDLGCGVRSYLLYVN